jgi:hypothetical protein
MTLPQILVRRAMRPERCRNGRLLHAGVLIARDWCHLPRRKFTGNCRMEFGLV